MTARRRPQHPATKELADLIRIRPYEDKDLAGVLTVWEQALPLDAVTRDEFERRVILDVNREPDSFQIAFEDPDEQPAGFILSLVLHRPIEQTGLLENRGFITAFAVSPRRQRRGIGAALLARAEEFFRARNRKEIVLAPYTPNYFVPGVDKERYACGVEFLRKRGFEEYVEAIAMDALIGQFELDQKTLETEARLRAEGVTIELFTRDCMAEYLEFMRKEMPGPWLEDARRNLIDLTRGLFPEDAILLARDHGKLIGYCQYEGAHFGPFGVIEGYQGRGVGTVLLARTLHQMRKRGHHAAYVLWTGDRAAKGVYGRLGFHISRRLAIVRKYLT